jgi:hypothetical protein
VRDSVEAFGEVGVEDVLGLEADEVEDGLYGVVGRASWTEAATVRLKPCFPFRFQCQLDQGLECPIEHRGEQDYCRAIGNYASLKQFYHQAIVHWVLYNIPRDVAELPSNATDADFGELGIVVGRNWSRETNYYPPCPLYGRHRYVFRIYALDIDTIQPETNDRRGVFKAMESHVLAYGELSGFYEK